MQDLEHDMEDLLRRAAEAYPLKRGEDKWDDIASKISGAPAGNKQKKGWQHKKYYTLPLLLFFLLLGFLVVKNGEKQNNTSLQKTKKYAAQPTSLAITNKKNETLILLESSTWEKSLFPDKGQSAVANLSPAHTKIPVSHNTVINSGITTKIKFDLTNNITFAGDESNSDDKLTIAKNGLARTIPDPGLARGIQDPGLEKESFFNTNKLSPEYNRVKQLDDLPLNKDVANINTRFSKKGFYYGIVSGVDINAVKDQGFKKAGFDVGVITGYRFNSALSIETGLLLAKKFYWTRGKYFSTEEMRSTMPAGTELIEVHGSSKVLEIPLHLRYDLSIKHNHRLFATAGFSSYILTEENNQYYTMLNGIQGKLNTSYKKDRRYFAAAIDLGLGYEKDLGKKSHIRFEPYLQLPVKGIGIGHLPVKSAGLRIAFTRSMH